MVAGSPSPSTGTSWTGPSAPGNLRRWTTRDFGAEDAEWSSADSLAILRAAPGSSASGVSSIYQARSGEESLGVEEITTGVLAMGRGPGGDGLILAIKTGSGQSTLALADEDGRIERLYTGTLDGIVTGVSLSPDGRAAILAIRARGEQPRERSLEPQRVRPAWWHPPADSAGR